MEKKIKINALFFFYFGILLKLTKFSPDKIKHEMERHTELTAHNASVAAVLGEEVNTSAKQPT